MIWQDFFISLFFFFNPCCASPLPPNATFNCLKTAKIKKPNIYGKFSKFALFPQIPQAGRHTTPYRQESYTRNKTQLFNDRCSKCNDTRIMMDCRRNTLWPLNLLSQVRTPITIGEQYFRSDANYDKFSFFRNGKRDLSLLDMMTAWKQHLNYKNNLSSLRRELM